MQLHHLTRAKIDLLDGRRCEIAVALWRDLSLWANTGSYQVP